MAKVESGFDSNCGNPKCKRRIGEIEMAFARPMGAEGKMITVCSKCCKEWDRDNLQQYTKEYIRNVIIPQMDKEKKERDERYDAKIKAEGVKNND